MRFSIASPDAYDRIDPPVNRILTYLPSEGGEHVTVVPITRLHDFKFDLRIGGPWVLVDFTEFGWDWKQDTSYLWGVNRLDHEWFKGDEWRKLDDFILKNPPILTFQRELLEKDVSDKHLPIEYLNYSQPVTPDTEEQFSKRPVDVMFNWGRSHEARPKLHGDIFRESGRYGYSVVSQWDHIERQCAENNPGGVWCAIHTPHFARIDCREAIEWFGKCKIVVAMNGCGVKTFRHGEIPNSIVASPMDELAWKASPRVWLSVDHIRELKKVLDGDWDASPYGLYMDSIEYADSLRPERYIAEYIKPEIRSRL